MDYIRINNFMINGERRVKRNEIIDIHGSDLNSIINTETKNTQMYNSKTNEISNEIIELVEDKTCRYCLEGQTYDNELITPCLCRGTQKYIHLKCLQKWRTVNKDNPEKRDFCEICKYHYAIKKNIDVLKYKLPNDLAGWFIYYFLIFFCTFIYALIDFNCDFFTLKILTPFLYNDTIVYNRFVKMKKYSETYVIDTSFDFYMYSFFMSDIVSLYVTLFFVIYYKKSIQSIKKLSRYKEIKLLKNLTIFIKRIN